MGRDVQTQDRIETWLVDHAGPEHRALYRFVCRALAACDVGIARRHARIFKFAWQDDGPWRAVYTMAGRRASPTYWVQAFAHELMHVAGYVRGRLPLPGRALAGYASTDAEEAVADAGAVILCRAFGVAPDMSYVTMWPTPDWTEVAARLALVTGSR